MGAPSPPARPPPADVPVGGEDVSRRLALVGQRREFGFPVKDHLQLGEELDLIDFETGGLVGALAPLAPACLLAGWLARPGEGLGLVDFEAGAPD